LANSWAGRAFYQLFVRYWAVVPGRKYAIEQQNNNINFLFVYCADIPAESYKLPSHRQCVDVVRHFAQAKYANK